MNSYLIVDGEDMSYLWNTVQQQQIVFHPEISPAGKIDIQKFFQSKAKKPYILFLDRNILSSLLKFCERGSLKNKGESQLIGIIMAWAEMNGISISAGFAVREYAAQLHSQEAGLIELQKFKEIFETYPGQMWLEVAEGQRAEIPPITYSQKPADNITVDYADAGDHYDMAVASLLCAVRLYRNNNLTAIEKFEQFFQWMYDHVLISEYLLVYTAMLFTGQENIKAPKNANSNEIEKIVAGCENQAWDISYLTNWSTMYSDPNSYAKEMLFATNDILLKRIFINKNGPNGFNGLLYEVFTKREYTQLTSFIEERMKNRVKPSFGQDTHAYFQQLIDQEKQMLAEQLSS